MTPHSLVEMYQSSYTLRQVPQTSSTTLFLLTHMTELCLFSYDKYDLRIMTVELKVVRSAHLEIYHTFVQNVTCAVMLNVKGLSTSLCAWQKAASSF
jgi:hypothetical protein